MNLPHTPEAAQDFIRTLSLAEVLHFLALDPIGAAFLSAQPDAGESDQRWTLFDILLCRAAFFAIAQKDKAALDAQAAAQLSLALEGRSLAAV